MKAISRSEAPAFICNLLQKKGRVRALREELSARVVAKALGQTTGFLYHHWGSFDGFLFEVSGIGWKRLVDTVVEAYERSEGDPRSIVFAYIDFAAENPVLYWLLAERPLSADVVQSTLASGELPSFAAFLDYFKLVKSVEPTTTIASARAMHAAAHGLASQLLSGRLGSTPDTVGRDEREVAREAAQVIADVFFPTASKARGQRSPAHDPKAAPPSRQRTTRPGSSSARSRSKKTTGT